MRRRFVVGYDGSEAAGHAVDFAASALAMRCAVVANVWHDPGASLALAPAAAPPPVPVGFDRDLEGTARAVAEQGVDRARAAGLDAFPVTRMGSGSGDVARTLQAIAAEYDGELIVVGHHHASLLEGALLGSVALSCVRDEGKPVLVVPE